MLHEVLARLFLEFLIFKSAACITYNVFTFTDDVDFFNKVGNDGDPDFPEF